ncbi:M24 family metallopeptidase [Candidatus Pelagibacter communis]|jgi:Xaa-Pro aminopeptidase|uniref:M24 family metallopeptidase n=1 Tax=Pelagibacter ubique TaxID=198252 RepID=UPI00094D66EB|nr:Xaa-Pro peptidase family protein [Candidatus Pelagibacter ubique]
MSSEFVLNKLDITDNDIKKLRSYRLSSLRTQMELNNIDACILSDAVNIRYATDARNMQIFTSRNSPSRYLILTNNKSILFEFKGCEHLSDHLSTIDEIRTSSTASFVASGHNIKIKEKEWVKDISNTLINLIGVKKTIGLERMNAAIGIGLQENGFKVVDAQLPIELARSIKSDEEIICIKNSLIATENAICELKESLMPGISENQLWSIFYKSIIEQDGDYCETRLLSSGEKTNPWFQETGKKIINQNELVAFDTDVVGCYGYYSDFSRTFHSGPDDPTKTQKELYNIAKDQVEHNINIIKEGMSFKEYSEKAWNIPDKYRANRYYLSAHGCGMTGEYPYLYHKNDYQESGYDGIIKNNMTLCVESYIGEKDGKEGVKLEQQILVKKNEIEILSKFPFEKKFLN